MGSTLSKKSSEKEPQDSKLSFFPKAPATPEELDIPVSMAEDLMLRYIYTKGASSLRELSRSIKLSFALLHTLFQRMRQQQLFEITGMDGNDYAFTLSGIGREQAAKRHLTCQYIGPAPVSVAAYTAAVRSQNIRLALDHALLKMALADLVLTKRFLDELGPALISQKSISLRPHRQRQNQRRQKAFPPASGHDRDPLRSRSGRPGDRALRPGRA